MPVTFTHIGGQAGALSGAINIDPVALTAGRLHILTVAANNATSAALADPSSVTQTGATWNRVASIAFSGSDKRKVAVYRCQPSSNIAAAAITVSWPGIADGIAHIAMSDDTVLDDTANNGAAVIVQAVPAFGSGTELAAALAAFGGVDNSTFIGGAGQAVTTFTSEWGASAILDQQADGGISSTHAFLAGEDTTPTITRSDANNWGIVALEVAATAPTPMSPWTIWNGTTEEPATATIWNGTTEEPLTFAEVTP